MFVSWIIEHLNIHFVYVSRPWESHRDSRSFLLSPKYAAADGYIWYKYTLYGGLEYSICGFISYLGCMINGLCFVAGTDYYIVFTMPTWDPQPCLLAVFRVIQDVV